MFAFVVSWLFLAPAPAEAYIGPGAGLTAIGTVVAFVGAVLLAIVGFVWYPIKRLVRSLRSRSARRGSGEVSAS
jgi:hypothetical protein